MSRVFATSSVRVAWAAAAPASLPSVEAADGAVAGAAASSGASSSSSADGGDGKASASGGVDTNEINALLKQFEDCVQFLRRGHYNETARRSFRAFAQFRKL